MPRDDHHVGIAPEEVSLLAARVCLGPLLLLQGRRVRRVTPRLPEAEGPRAGIEGAGAGSPLRLLVVGDSSAAGVGVSHQQAALAQPTARALARRIGRPVKWQLVARSGACTEEAIELLRASPVSPADVLVTALGVNDVTGQRAARFVGDIAELWRVAARHAGVRHGVLAGLPPMHAFPAVPQPLRWYLGQYARGLDASLEAWIAAQPHLRFCSMQWPVGPGSVATDGFHPGPEGYARWSEAMAAKAAEVLGHA